MRFSSFLSGFIISYSARKASPRSFVVNRFLRLYPAAWVCSILTALVLLLSRSGTLDSVWQLWWKSAVLYPQGPYIDPSYWTLPVELAFYAVVFLTLLAGKVRHLDVAIGTLGTLSALSWLYVSLRLHMHLPVTGPRTTYTAFFLQDTLIAPLFLEYSCFFAIGTLLSTFLFDRVSLLRALAFLLCIGGGIVEVRDRARTLLTFFHGNYSLTPPVLLWLTAIAIMAASVIFHEPLTRLLGRRGSIWTRCLGLITYPLYLTHQVIGFALLHALGALPLPFALVLTMISIVALSFFIHLVFEKPLRTFLRNHVFGRRRSTMPIAATLP